jgi:hypothetical protein
MNKLVLFMHAKYLYLSWGIFVSFVRVLNLYFSPAVADDCGRKSNFHNLSFCSLVFHAPPLHV